MSSSSKKEKKKKKKSSGSDGADGWFVKSASSPNVHPGVEDAQYKSSARRLAVRVLIYVYLFSVLLMGYWYWMRPVRTDQFKAAQEKWRGIADSFHLPIPKDERWGW